MDIALLRPGSFHHVSAFLLPDVSTSSSLAQANQELKTELSNRIQIYQESMAQLESIQEENKNLQKEQTEKCVTKKQLTDLLAQRVKGADMKCKDLEK